MLTRNYKITEKGKAFLKAVVKGEESWLFKDEATYNSYVEIGEALSYLVFGGESFFYNPRMGKTLMIRRLEDRGYIEIDSALEIRQEGEEVAGNYLDRLQEGYFIRGLPTPMDLEDLLE